MAAPDMAHQGEVVAVSTNGKHSFSKNPRLLITLVAGHGIDGDAHFGPCVKHRYFARRNPRARNLRQVHLIPGELFEVLRDAGYDVSAGELGENITTSGLDLESLPLDAELRIGANASVRLTGLRTPCVLIDRFKSGLKARLIGNGPGPLYRAGVMGVVSQDGEVLPGDPICVALPVTPHRQLQPL